MTLNEIKGRFCCLNIPNPTLIKTSYSYRVLKNCIRFVSDSWACWFHTRC